MTRSGVRQKQLRLPREHGFWAMLSTVLVTACLRTPLSLPVGVALCVTLAAAVVLAGHFGQQIRRSPQAQLGSSLLLAFAGVPLQVAGAAETSELIATTSVWAVLFFSCSLLVRAAFARTGRAGENPWRARRLTTWALALGGCATAALYAANLPVHAASVALGMLGCAAIAAARPSVKQLKPVGIALAVLIASAGLVLSFGERVA
ncbi:MAG TPA: hypothetical protein VFU02_08020 [Polyangiaceae bacterium]|nr:hypothetical protein [Polyangiaceae bacterium]